MQTQDSRKLTKNTAAIETTNVRRQCGRPHKSSHTPMQAKPSSRWQARQKRQKQPVCALPVLLSVMKHTKKKSALLSFYQSSSCSCDRFVTKSTTKRTASYWYHTIYRVQRQEKPRWADVLPERTSKLNLPRGQLAARFFARAGTYFTERHIAAVEKSTLHGQRKSRPHAKININTQRQMCRARREIAYSMRLY